MNKNDTLSVSESHKKALYLVDTLTPYQIARMFVEVKEERDSKTYATTIDIITQEEKDIVQNNIDYYLDLGLIMSRASLDIIQKMLDNLK